MSINLEKQLLAERKVKALERISKNMDTLVLWFEEIDKEEWNERIQYYLSEFLNNNASPKLDKEESEDKDA